MRYYDWFADGSLVVGAIGLACCVVETEAATAGRPELTGVPDGARVVLAVAGTVTDAVAPLVAATVAAHPGASVVSFGACASAGGPYWDSPVVTKGVDQLVPVDHYLPGCPPTPAALAALLEQEYRHG
ncbi:NADH-quinone oxidoreductase subunit B [Propioniciclava sinopodophylli]|uniref:NADH-quinone oxidoreductase subunit B n=1 Tax=Propioniciclava sinopodophylli TaxID=1837344 RepID=UPI002491E1EB|nr:proton-conducting membrane transporter [Propioniciclava sinopodophylli]